MLEREGNIIYEIVGNTVTARYVDTWSTMLGKEICNSFPKTLTVLPSPVYFIYSHQYKECGIAKCSPNDKFDEEFGKKLTRERLVTKYNRMRFRYFKQVERILHPAHRIVFDKMVKYLKAITHKKEG